MTQVGTWDSAPGTGSELELRSRVKNAPRQYELETVPPIRSDAVIVYVCPPKVKVGWTFASHAKKG